MASNILSIGKTALNAAQVGIATTGHNIANASTPGYHRQEIIQAAAQAQNFGYGFVGQGTDITAVQRVYNETLANQMTRATTASAGSQVYYDQITQIDNMLSDAEAGLNPAMTSFFSGVSAVAANPNDIATRQTLMSSAQTLVNRFTSIDSRLNDIRESVNTQIGASVDEVNAYAKQISSLNDIIDKALSSTGKPPNDLMDQRDLLVSKLSGLIKTTVIQQNAGTYNVFIGNGLPLVVGADSYNLTTMSSPTDPNRLEVAYQGTNKTTVLGADSLPGGTIGGLLQFRNDSLDPAQNQLGQLAITMSEQFNAQHKLGFDLNGTAGTDLFSYAAPVSTSSTDNADGGLTVGLTTSIVDASKLTSSDYRVQYNGTNYVITRQSDKKEVWNNAALPTNLDGLSISISGTPASGDDFMVRPTVNAASNFKLTFDDVNKLAFAGSATSGPSDNVNGLKLVALQNAKTVSILGNTNNRTFAQAFALMVSGVGTKTNELSITSKADQSALELATTAVESESGVNLDEEATNLIRYQQAYQAAGKMMQIASQLFDVLLQLGQ